LQTVSHIRKPAWIASIGPVDEVEPPRFKMSRMNIQNQPRNWKSVWGRRFDVAFDEETRLEIRWHCARHRSPTGPNLRWIN